MIRYMGTKRHIAGAVHDAIDAVAGPGAVLDLFAGMGSVADEFTGERAVHLNDASEFVACLLRDRFLPSVSFAALDPGALDVAIAAAVEEIAREHTAQLNQESLAILGEPSLLSKYFATAEHVGTSVAKRRAASVAAQESGFGRYRLAALYFSGGYLSLSQAIEADAIRYVIETQVGPEFRDRLISEWLSAISSLLNAPGHSAQFMKPSSRAAVDRIKKAWRRSLRDEFISRLRVSLESGECKSRNTRNRVSNLDSLAYLRSGISSEVAAVYADPPYTRDQYGRFYHVYETLYRYDFPESRGLGRVRQDTFSSSFSRKSLVVQSMRELLRQVSRYNLPLVVSYPTNGLLSQAGTTLSEIAGDYFPYVEVHSIASDHSTLGASSGARRKATIEQLIVCGVGKGSNR